VTVGRALAAAALGLAILVAGPVPVAAAAPDDAPTPVAAAAPDDVPTPVAAAAPDDAPPPVAGGAVGVGLVVPADPIAARDLTDGATLAVEAAARAGRPPPRLTVRAVASSWGSAGSTTVALVRQDGAQVVVAPPDRAIAHEVVQLASKLGVPVLNLARASSVTGTGSPWCVTVVPTIPEGADARPVAPPLPFVVAFAARFRRAPGPGAAEAFDAVTRVVEAGPAAGGADARARCDALRSAVATRAAGRVGAPGWGARAPVLRRW